MPQSRMMSLVEAGANVVVGYGVAVATQLLVFPPFGLEATLAQNLTIGLIFTVVSLVRSYALRRAFEEIADLAIEYKSGARSLRGLFEELITPVLFAVPDHPEVKRVEISSLFVEPRYFRTPPAR